MRNGKRGLPEWVPAGGMLACLLLLFGGMVEHFWTIGNFLNILLQSADMLLVGIGMCLVLLGGNLDLSCGSAMALVSVCCGRLLLTGAPVWAVIPAGLLLGAAVGLGNGILVSHLKSSSVIITLVTALILRGAAMALTRGETLHGLPEAFCFWGKGRLFGIPLPVALVVGLLLLFSWILAKTVFGRRIYVVGESRETAGMMGISAAGTVAFTYLCSGLLAAAAGILLTGRLTVASAGFGEGMELNTLSGLVIGGISITGGRGRLSGAFLGCLLIAVLVNGMSLMNTSPYYTDLIRGCVILFAIFLESARLYRKTQRERGRE